MRILEPPNSIFIICSSILFITCNSRPANNLPFNLQPIYTRNIITSWDLDECLIDKKNDKIFVAGFSSTSKKLGFWDTTGKNTGFLHLERDYNQSHGISLNPLEFPNSLILFSEHCDSFDNIFVNDTIINQQDTILADFFCAETDLYFSNTGTYQIRDSYESFYKINRNQAKGFLSGCLSKNYSYYIKDANIYIAKMGSIYADKLQKSRSGSLSPHPEDVYLSKGVCFWDKILYFNPPKGDLFYYAPLKLEFFYDNVLDTAQAIAFPILVNTPQKTLQESERSAKHIPSYYDPNTQILYFIDEHTPKKFSLNSIKIQPK